MESLFSSDYGLALVATVLGAVFAFVHGTRLYNKSQFRKAWQAIEVGVEKTYQEYVAGLKKGREDGKLTEAEKAEARQMAKEVAIQYGFGQGVDVARVLTHEFLDVAIARVVKAAKAGLGVGLALLLCVGVLGCATQPTITVTYPDGRTETRTDTAALAAYVEAARLTADSIRATILEVERQKADSEALADKAAAADAAARRAFWLDVLSAREDLDQGAKVAVKTAQTELTIQPRE